MSDHQNGSAQASNGKSNAAGSAHAIDLTTFQTRLKSFYNHWTEAIAFLTGQILHGTKDNNSSIN